MMASRRALRAALLIAGIAVMLAAQSCATRVLRPVDIGPPAPIPNSPINLLRLLEWCYDYRSIPMYRQLFTNDFRFVFSASDSAGASYRNFPWGRDQELQYFTHLVLGGGSAYPAASIDLQLDKNLLVTPDARYPWDPTGRWHRTIRSQVLLGIRTTNGDAIDISGAARFYLVRGDSASIPSDLGASPDSARWYIQRWDDETIQSLRAEPGQSYSWGRLKATYQLFAPD